MMGKESTLPARNGQQANHFHSRAAGCISGLHIFHKERNPEVVLQVPRSGPSARSPRLHRQTSCDTALPAHCQHARAQGQPIPAADCRGVLRARGRQHDFG